MNEIITKLPRSLEINKFKREERESNDLFFCLNK